MATVTLKVSSRQETDRRFLRAFERRIFRWRASCPAEVEIRDYH
jgi:hypothetical protein